MKKLFSFVLVACMTMLAMTFTSCEKKASEADYPIVGHTFEATDAGGTARLVFHSNFTVTQSTSLGASAVFNWDMKGTNVELLLRQPINFLGTQLNAGDVIYRGTYDATLKTLSLRDVIVGDLAVYEQVQ